jgi:O-antigen/teichoic acid export membrane protein
MVGVAVADLNDPLSRSAYSLMGNTVLTAGLGLGFWLLAARLFSSDEVGRDSALIVSMMALSTFGQLNLNIAIARFLPRAGRRTSAAVLGAYGLGVGVSLVLATAFVLIMPRLSESFEFLASDRALEVTYVLAVALWSIFALQDAVLTALRRAPWVPVENGAFGLLKIVGLLLLSAAGAAHGVFIAWVVPMLLLLAPVNYLIFRRAIPVHVERHPQPSSVVVEFTRRQLARFLGQDYFASVIGLGTVMVLPLLVVALVGTQENAYFYIAYTIITTFELLFVNIVTSLTVEGAFDEQRIVELSRRVARRLAALAVPGSLVLIVAAPLLLSPFGSEYERESAPVLRVLACATVFRATVGFYNGIQRLHGRGLPIVVVNGLRTVILLPLTVVLAGPLGIEGVAIAWLAASAPVALGVTPWLVRYLRGSNPFEVPSARAGVSGRVAGRAEGSL